MYSKSLSPVGLLADDTWGSVSSQQPHLLSFEICCIFNFYYEFWLRGADANRLNKLIRKASDVVGVELDTLTAVSGRRMLSKVWAILQCSSHLLHNALVEQRSTFQIVYFTILLFICILLFFDILCNCNVCFNILFLFTSSSLSLVFIHTVFLFLLCTEHCNKKIFSPGDKVKYSESESEFWIWIKNIMKILAKIKTSALRKAVKMKPHQEDNHLNELNLLHELCPGFKRSFMT